MAGLVPKWDLVPNDKIIYYFSSSCLVYATVNEKYAVSIALEVEISFLYRKCEYIHYNAVEICPIEMKIPKAAQKFMELHIFKNIKYYLGIIPYIN